MKYNQTQNKPKVFILDVDGVMTDGKVMVNTKGEEFKTFCYKDFDAFGEF